MLFRSIVEVDDTLNLMLDFHHLIFDGTSLDIFINELNAAIEGEKPTSESYTYYDYVATEQEQETSGEFKLKGLSYCSRSIYNGGRARSRNRKRKVKVWINSIFFIREPATTEKYTY